jgi:hypothetical protein
MTADFVNAIKTGTKPIADAQSGLNVVRLLEAADQSVKMGGLVIRLPGDGNGYRGVSLAEMQECAATRASGDPCPIQLLFNSNKDAAK